MTRELKIQALAVVLLGVAQRPAELVKRSARPAMRLPLQLCRLRPQRSVAVGIGAVKRGRIGLRPSG